MHKPIKMFTEEGLIKDDKYFIRTRDEMERAIIEQMRSQGCLPIYELGTFWSTKWLGDKYSFKLTIYGWFAGKKRSQEYDFWCEGKLMKSG
jgi:hypothetical protein